MKKPYTKPELEISRFALEGHLGSSPGPCCPFGDDCPKPCPPTCVACASAS